MSRLAGFLAGAAACWLYVIRPVAKAVRLW